jgi:hypothetical protein
VARRPVPALPVRATRSSLPGRLAGFGRGRRRARPRACGPAHQSSRPWAAATSRFLSGVPGQQAELPIPAPGRDAPPTSRPSGRLRDLATAAGAANPAPPPTRFLLTACSRPPAQARGPARHHVADARTCRSRHRTRRQAAVSAMFESLDFMYVLRRRPRRCGPPSTLWAPSAVTAGHDHPSPPSASAASDRSSAAGHLDGDGPCSSTGSPTTADSTALYDRVTGIRQLRSLTARARRSVSTTGSATPSTAACPDAGDHLAGRFDRSQRPAVRLMAGDRDDCDAALPSLCRRGRTRLRRHRAMRGRRCPGRGAA